MKPTSQELKKIYLKRIEKIKPTTPKTPFLRKMRDRLCEEFDEVWIKYEKNQATYDQWKKALDKWLSAEIV